MEPQRRELLAQCQQSLAQAMTEVEAVLGLLEAAGALSPGERRQLDEEAGGAKAELLLKLLLAKERDHFHDLRAALEKTQPHLLPILYLNGVVGPPQPAEGAGECQTPLPGPSHPPSATPLSGSPRGEVARAIHLPGAGRGENWLSFSPPGEGLMRGPPPPRRPPLPTSSNPALAVNNAGHCRPSFSRCRGTQRGPLATAGSSLRGDLGGMSSQSLF